MLFKCLSVFLEISVFNNNNNNNENRDLNKNKVFFANIKNKDTNIVDYY